MIVRDAAEFPWDSPLISVVRKLKRAFRNHARRVPDAFTMEDRSLRIYIYNEYLSIDDEYLSIQFNSILLRVTKSFRKLVGRKDMETVESESKKSVEFEFYYNFSKILLQSI